MALELQVAHTAAAMQALATATARQVAVDTIRTADLILASEQRLEWVRTDTSTLPYRLS